MFGCVVRYLFHRLAWMLAARFRELPPSKVVDAAESFSVLGFRNHSFFHQAAAYLLGDKQTLKSLIFQDMIRLCMAMAQAGVTRLAVCAHECIAFDKACME